MTKTMSKSDQMFSDNVMKMDLAERLSLRDSYARCTARAFRDNDPGALTLLRWFDILDEACGSKAT